MNILMAVSIDTNTNPTRKTGAENPSASFI